MGDASTSTATTFDVFLSHSSVDKPSVEVIAERLIAEAGLRPFVDRWHLVVLGRQVGDSRLIGG